MTVQFKPLIEPVQIANSATVYYTSTGVTTAVDKMTVSNPSASTPYSVIIYWVPSGGSPGTANILLPLTFVQPGSALDILNFIGHTLGIGDEIAALASTAAALNFFASGRTFS